MIRKLVAPLMLLIGLCSCGADMDEQTSVSRAERSLVTIDNTGVCYSFTDGPLQPNTATCAGGTTIQCLAATYDTTACPDGKLPCGDSCQDQNATFGSDAAWDSSDWDRTSEVQLSTFAYLAANTATRLADKPDTAHCRSTRALVTKGYTWFTTGTGWAATAIQANKGIIPKYYAGATATSTGSASIRAAALKASLHHTLRLLSTFGGC